MTDRDGPARELALAAMAWHVNERVSVMALCGWRIMIIIIMA